MLGKIKNISKHGLTLLVFMLFFVVVGKAISCYKCSIVEGGEGQITSNTCKTTRATRCNFDQTFCSIVVTKKVVFTRRTTRTEYGCTDTKANDGQGTDDQGLETFTTTCNKDGCNRGGGTTKLKSSLTLLVVLTIFCQFLLKNMG
ncbi:uncharacterized protein LOC143462449 [Clavelina lepadiformis]|uniref:Uncharacterized protein n=1 Tax=Clavelina lepadiformis TaxID=159417 RepID=A0ABP0GMC0_CLALP